MHSYLSLGLGRLGKKAMSDMGVWLWGATLRRNWSSPGWGGVADQARVGTGVRGGGSCSQAKSPVSESLDQLGGLSRDSCHYISCN